MTKAEDKKAAEAKTAADKKAAAEKKAREDKATAEAAKVKAKTAPLPEKAKAGTHIPEGMSSYSTRLKEEMPEAVKKALKHIKGKVLDWSAKDDGTVVVTELGQRYTVKRDGSVIAPKPPRPKKKPKSEDA